MKKIFKRILFLFVILSHSVFAENSITSIKLTNLNEALQIGLKNSKRILVSRYELDKAKGDKITASLRPNPYISLNADVFPYYKGKFDPEAQQYGINLGYQIETAGKREARMNLADKNMKVTELLFAEAVRQVYLMIGTVYYETLAAKERLLLAEDNYTAMNLIAEINKKRLSKQDISNLELIRSEVARDQYATQIIQNKVSYLRSKAALTVLLGHDSNKIDIQINENLAFPNDPPEIQVDTAIQSALHGRPDYLALIGNEELSISNIRLQKSHAVPDVVVALDAFNQQNQKFYGATVTVPIPVFSRNQGEIAKSIATKKQAEKSKEELYLNLTNEIKILSEEIKIRYSAIKNINQNSIIKSTEAIKIMELAYKSGGATLIEYMDTRRAFNETRLMLIDTLMQYETVLFRYKYSLGFDLNLNTE
ncbi:MAG: TolC family protein [Leptospiraceae bacterium]|nr:TolC family protein [Leptospiraceae bacterium]MCK6382027.1 TolC family protein [Leptospiraceae bacterium]NUM41999.1 TolC family protein [Leptospiraceae bacterium]